MPRHSQQYWTYHPTRTEILMDNATQSTLLFLIQVLTLIALIIYVAKTWEMASATRKAAEATEQSVTEMKETRDQQTRPYVIAYFMVKEGTGLIYLILKNIGQGVARNVRFSFDPPLITSSETINQMLAKMSFVTEGIQSMPPGYELKTLFDSTVSYLNNEELPQKYKVRISYYGGIRPEERIDEYVLDISVFWGLSYTRKTTMKDLVKKTEDIGNELSRIRQDIRQIAQTMEGEDENGNGEGKQSSFI